MPYITNAHVLVWKTKPKVIIWLAVWLTQCGLLSLHAQPGSTLNDAFAQANRLSTEGLYSQAADLLEGLPDQNHYWLKTKVGQLRLLANQPAVAKEAYAAAIRLKPKAISARLGMAQCATNQGNTIEAIAIHLRILSIDALQPDALFGVVKLYTQTGWYAKGLPFAQKYCDHYTQNAQAYYYLAKCLFGQGQIQEAFKALNKALWLQPDYPEALEAYNTWSQPPE